MDKERYKPNLEDIDSIMDQHGETHVAGYKPTLEDIDSINKNKSPKNLWELVQNPELLKQSEEMLSKLPGDKIFKLINSSRKIPGALQTFKGDLSTLWKNIVNSPKEIPKKYEAAKEVYPEIQEQVKNDPSRFARNLAAGTADIGQEVMNIPHTLGKIGEHYGFVNPEEVPKEKNISKNLQEFVGGTQTQADKAIRKVMGHIPDVIGSAGLARGALRRVPTAENVAQNVVRGEAGQVGRHQAMYQDLFNRGNQQGYGRINFNPQNIDIPTLERGSVPRSTHALEEFVQNPTLENAQRAKSDMSNIIREMEEKAGKKHITDEERGYLVAAQNARNEIQNNMFRHPQTGQINQELLNNYNNIQRSYAENVIPYSKHPQLQEYKRRNLTARELLQALKGGKFEVRKGGQHPGIKVNEILSKYGIPIGGIGLLSYPVIKGSESILRDLLSSELPTQKEY